MVLEFRKVSIKSIFPLLHIILLFLDSPYRDILSDTILQLQDEGAIHKLYDKWWKEAANLKCDQDDKRKEVTPELGFSNIGGIFVILAVGLVLSMIVAAIEFSIKIRNRKGREVCIKKDIYYFRFDKISCFKQHRYTEDEWIRFFLLFSRTGQIKNISENRFSLIQR